MDSARNARVWYWLLTGYCPVEKPRSLKERTLQASPPPLPPCFIRTNLLKNHEISALAVYSSGHHPCHIASRPLRRTTATNPCHVPSPGIQISYLSRFPFHLADPHFEMWNTCVPLKPARLATFPPYSPEMYMDDPPIPCPAVYSQLFLFHPLKGLSHFPPVTRQNIP